MKEHSAAKLWPRPVWTLVSLLVVAAAARAIAGGPGPQATVGTGSTGSAPPPMDSVAANQLIQPAALARALADSSSARPEVLQIGFKVLFRGGHIRGSRYIGPASKPEGLAALTRALAKIPRSRDVVLYCGCCPWADCPNVRPAIQAARRMGFRRVRVLYIAKNLQRDWIDKGFPIGEGDQ
jgi:thiosulfate/3-mercaptopyruvate sulfurtransferase